MNGRTLNKIVLVGAVGRTPEATRDPRGLKTSDEVAFSVATSSPDREYTDWHRLVARGKVARFCRDHVRVGTRVFVTGSVRYDSDERDGITVPVTWVGVSEVSVLNSRNEVIASSRHTPKGVIVNDVINTEAGHDPEEEEEWE